MRRIFISFIILGSFELAYAGSKFNPYAGRLQVTAGSSSGIATTVNGGYGIGTAVSGSTVTVNLLPNSTSYIQNTNSLQSGATFYVSSGTVSGQFSVKSIKYSDGTIQTSSPTASGGSTVLTSSHIYVGNGSGVSTDVALSGDAIISNTGSMTVQKFMGISSTTILLQSVEYVISGSGSAITTGSKGFIMIEDDCTITGWTVLGDQSGSIVIDVKRSTYGGFPTTASIVGAGNKPTLSSAQNNQAAPASWTSVTISAGDVLEFNVDSITTVQRALLSLKTVRR